MKNIHRLTIPVLFFMLHAACAVPPLAAQEEVTDAAISYESSGSALSTQPTPAPTPSVSFSLQDSDIIAWEESGEGKYIYLTISDEKNEELARITQDHLGEAMELNLGDNFILIPEITHTLSQKNGFVIYQPEEARRKELILMMLGWQKEQDAGTAIDIETSESGTAHSAP